MNCAKYVSLSKQALGNPKMSDRELGERLGPQLYMSQLVSRARRGYMLDSMALDVGKLLKRYELIDHAGEVLVVARAEREKDIEVRATMLDYVGKILASVPLKAVGALGAVTVALGLIFSPSHDAMAFGGAGRFRKPVQ